MKASEQTFRAKCPALMRAVMKEFALTVEDAAAIAGNAGHESAGFTKLQEISPTVKNSRGGFGWFQWTGPRRRAYETWCKQQGWSPSADQANIGFLLHELRGPESRAIRAVSSAKGLANKTVAFEQAFERAGVKHYSSRIQWAHIALDAFDGPVPMPTPKPLPEAPKGIDKPMAKSKTGWGAILLGGIGSTLTALSSLDWRVQLALVAVVVGASAYIWIERKRFAKDFREFSAGIGGE